MTPQTAEPSCDTFLALRRWVMDTMRLTYATYGCSLGPMNVHEIESAAKLNSELLLMDCLKNSEDYDSKKAYRMTIWWVTRKIAEATQ